MKLIVEMEMPRNCDECEVNYDCVFCGITGSAFYGNMQMPNFMPDKQKLPDCPIVGVLPDEHGDLVDYDEVEKEFNRLLTYMEKVPDENGINWFRRETIMPRGYEMKFHVIVKAEKPNKNKKST